MQSKPWTEPGLTIEDRAKAAAEYMQTMFGGLLLQRRYHLVKEAIESAVADLHRWQPIETAPKDKCIWLWNGGLWDGNWSAHESAWVETIPGLILEPPPTHWQRLWRPEPPKEDENR